MPPFHIAHIPITPPVVLAPMEGVTDRAFRTLIRSLGGCGLAVTEFVSSEGLTREVERAWKMAELDPLEHPVSIQIYGRDPARMALAARHCQELGADIVDINLGCPSKRVVTGCAGSALMREPELTYDIFRAVRDAIDVPMTVKMRLGWDHTHYSAPEIAARAEELGASMITVHGRTRSDQYKGQARWDLVGLVKKAVNIPVLVNGDITGPKEAFEALSQSGADGVMVGRGVMHDPWTLRRIAAAFAGETYVLPTLEQRREALQGYLDRVAMGEVDRATLVKIKQVAGYFTRGLYGAAHLRKLANVSGGLDEVRRHVDEFFAMQRDDQPRTSAEAPLEADEAL